MSFHLLGSCNHVWWVACPHGIEYIYVTDGEGLRILRAAANILTKQSRTAENRRSTSLCV